MLCSTMSNESLNIPINNAKDYFHIIYVLYSYLCIYGIHQVYGPVVNGHFLRGRLGFSSRSNHVKDLENGTCYYFPA